jgi:ribonuclease HII
MNKKRQKVDFNKNLFEKTAWEAQKSIIGVDEVGRGCLAGPLVTAAAILPIGRAHPLLKDSKAMTPQERDRAFIWIDKHCIYSVSILHNRAIDTLNIWHATLWAMKRAVLQLLASHNRHIGAILVDAMPLSLADTHVKDVPVHHFPFGESKSSSIAAASIVAKVTRDRLMGRMGQYFPAYALEQHKGYGTPEHRYAIMQHGHSIIHRESFLSNIRKPEEGNPHANANTQQTIW